MRLIIRDGTEPAGGGWLTFGLPAILSALGENALRWVWRGRDIKYITRDDRDVAVIEALSDGRVLTGTDLVAGIEQRPQIIDGNFEATEPGGGSAIVVIRAVDSTWWEVSSDDAAVLAAIKRRFRAVEEA